MVKIFNKNGKKYYVDIQVQASSQLLLCMRKIYPEMYSVSTELGTEMIYMNMVNQQIWLSIYLKYTQYAFCIRCLDKYDIFNLNIVYPFIYMFAQNKISIMGFRSLSLE